MRRKNVVSLTTVVATNTGTYLALQVANKELVQGLASLVAVADILESLGGVLAADVENDFLTTAVECVSACNWAVRCVKLKGGLLRLRGAILLGTYGCSSMNWVQS